MGMNTPLLMDGDGLGFKVVAASAPVLEPADVADAVIEGLRDGRFLILPHPEVLEYFRRKAADYDRWLAGMRRLQASVEASNRAPRADRARSARCRWPVRGDARHGWP